MKKLKKKNVDSAVDLVVGAGTVDKVEGTALGLLGQAQEGIGKLLGNPELQAQGTANLAEGNLQKATGTVKEETEQLIVQTKEQLQEIADAVKRIV